MQESNICTHCQLEENPDALLWVKCDRCPQWVHVNCVPLTCIHSLDIKNPQVLSYPHSSKEIKSYRCVDHKEGECLNISASSLRKGKRQRDTKKTEDGNHIIKKYNFRNNKVIDYIALNEGESKRDKMNHPHKDTFLKCFEKWENDSNIISAVEFAARFNDIKEPYKISDPTNSGVYIPKVDTHNGVLTVNDITEIMGENYHVDVMDVQTQMNENWTLGSWNEYFTNTQSDKRDRIRNVISLEVSDIAGLHLKRPTTVRQNDLVDKIWNCNRHLGQIDEEAVKEDDPRPKVTKYILMSVKDAYTDFHLDFAGTSVYYNVISGQKKFLLFPPTRSNIDKYIEWSLKEFQNSIFLGDFLEDGIAMELNAGDLFMIPSGYIHAVYTPVDSLIFGGNFLTIRDLETHLKVVEVERLTKVPKRFTFPKFDRVIGKLCECLVLDRNKPFADDCNTDLIAKTTDSTIRSLYGYFMKPEVKYKPLNFTSRRHLGKALAGLLS
ncbi:YER051W [Saccharomyces arboricola H-6]|uniref:JmjC domain-containing histone demethylation protein 1 n=1 Tax=Saccharomyces arboricola (strain H-6 / AS 2.3317 / CBS 10644) TaxID=1160507 RepID=J8Q621_SACAR|nr:YER051W [Saccharomyces arboricola H-6]